MSQSNDKFYSHNMYIYVLYIYIYICIIYIHIYIIINVYILLYYIYIYMYINIYLDSKYQVLDQMLHPKSLLQLNDILLLFLIHCF